MLTISVSEVSQKLETMSQGDKKWLANQYLLRSCGFKVFSYQSKGSGTRNKGLDKSFSEALEEVLAVESNMFEVRDVGDGKVMLDISGWPIWIEVIAHCKDVELLLKQI